MATAEIITIGTELLLGEIIDSNASFLAKALNDAGYDIYRITTVGDNIERISQAMQDALKNSDIVVTTGGLGPTVDDPTREAAALAIDRPTIYHPELWEQIEARFLNFHSKASENNKRQAYLPETAIAIENAVGTAPAFYLTHNDSYLICLPGVPSEMKYLLQNKILPLIDQLMPANAALVTRTIHTIGLGESHIDEQIGHLEELQNPTVGLAAHFGEVDIRICAKAATRSEAAALILPIEQEILELFQDNIYGYDGEDILNALATKIVEENVVIRISLNEDLSFLQPSKQDLLALIEQKRSDIDLKNQYNNKKQMTFEFTLVLDKSVRDTPLLKITTQGANIKNEEIFKFLYNPIRFEKWARNRMLRVIFQHIHSKG